ncbi:MAG: FliI/YscN family ATPase [Paracoccaceae bacterium]
MTSIQCESLVRPLGRVAGVSSGLVEITGLEKYAAIGDRVEVSSANSAPTPGEVVKISNRIVFILPDFQTDNLALGNSAVLLATPPFSPSDDWTGRVLNPFGFPLDGMTAPQGGAPVQIHAKPLSAGTRRDLGNRINTGSTAFNTFLPIVTGQRLGLFAGSGVGKSMLLSNLAKHSEADVIVVAMIGERGREVNEFVRNTLGPEGLKRSVVIAATSDQPATFRRRSAWAAMTVAEHFRNQGQNVLLLADSVTRFAEAHRDIAAATGELPTLRGFPPSMASLLANLCERAGPGSGGQGNITAIFSVLVAGSDNDEPIADTLRGILDGHIVLSRKIAERGRFPAIDLIKSVSRSLPNAATDEENKLLTNIRLLLAKYEKSETLVQAGLYQSGNDPELDQAIQIWPEVEQFLTRFDEPSVKSSFNQLQLIHRRSTARLAR